MNHIITECSICQHQFKAGEEFATSNLKLYQAGADRQPITLHNIVLCESCMDIRGDGYRALGHGGSGIKYDWSTMNRFF